MKAFIFFMLVGLSLCEALNSATGTCVIDGLLDDIATEEDGFGIEVICKLIEVVKDFGCAGILDGNVSDTSSTWDDIAERSAGAGLSGEAVCKSMEKMKADECRNTLIENLAAYVLDNTDCHNLAPLVQKLNGLVKSLLDDGEEIAQCTAASLTGQNSISSLQNTLGSLTILDSLVQNLLGSLTNGLGGAGNGLGGAGNVLNPLTSLLRGTGNGLGGTGSLLGGTENGHGGVWSLLDSLTSGHGGAGSLLDSLTKLLDSLTNGHGSKRNSLGGTGNGLGSLTNELGSLTSVLSNIKNLASPLKTVLHTVEGLFSKIKNSAGCVQKGVKNVDKIAKELKEVVTELLGNKGCQGNGISNITNLLKALKVLETPQCINSDLAETILDNPVLKALFEAFGYALIKPS